MEKFLPTYVKDPKPLAFVVGTVDNEPDFKDRLISYLSQALLESDPKDIPPIEFRPLKSGHYFPDKLPQKELPSTEGILKLNWVTKYNDILPSVVLMVFSFSAEWAVAEWVRRESAILEYYTKVRNPLNGREIKIILIPYKTGAGSSEVYEDRMAAFKRRFQIDGRNIYLLTPQDMLPGANGIKRLGKIVRESSNSFYVGHAKRFRNVEKGLKEADLFLIARYNFKVSFFSEFQGLSSRALRHYKSAYTALTNIYNIYHSVFDSVAEQAKAVGEWVNYRICLLLLRSGQIRDASQQLRGHVSSFMKVPVATHVWSHYAWLSDQYIIFAQLLDMCAINPSFIDADRSYYYHNAALYSTKRQASMQGIRKAIAVEDDSAIAKKFKSIVLGLPKYLGAPPTIIDPSPDPANRPTEDTIKALLDYHFVSTERNVDYKTVILDLLKKSLDSLTPHNRRRKSQIRYLMAKQFMIQGKYELASMNLNAGIDLLFKEGWAAPLVSMLRKKIACSFYMGRIKEYMAAALKLTSIAAAAPGNFITLGKAEQEELYRDIMSILTSVGPPSEAYLEALRSDVSDAGVGYVGVTWRPQFGVAATEGSMPEYSLPDGFVTEFSDAGIHLFKVGMSIAPLNVYIGQSFRAVVTITSMFPGKLSFAEMSLHFSDDLIVQKLTHEGSESGGCNVPKGGSSAGTTGMKGTPFPASLVFEPNVPVKFSVEIFVPETSVGTHLDTYVCLEKVRLLMRVARIHDGSEPASLQLRHSIALRNSMADERASFDVRRTSLHLNQIPESNLEEGVDASHFEEDTVFTPSLAKAIEASDAQFVPAEEESAPPGPGDSAGPDVMPSHRITEVGIPPEVERQMEPDEPIITTSERMRSISIVDMSMMENIDIALADATADPAPAAAASQPTDTETPEEEDGLNKRIDSEEETPVAKVSDLGPLSESMPNDAGTSEQALIDPFSERPDAERGSEPHRRDSLEPQKTEESPVAAQAEAEPVPDPSAVTAGPERAISPTQEAADECLIPSAEEVVDVEEEDPTPAAAATQSAVLETVVAVKSEIVPIPRSQTSESIESSEKNYRELVFDVIAVSRMFRETRYSSPNVTLKDIADFVGPHAPRVLHISRPVPQLKLITATDVITSLQGLMLRANLVFSTEGDELRNGKLLLSSDQSPQSASSSLFWYPDLNSIARSCQSIVNHEGFIDASALSTNKFLDKISFHPFSIGANCQPVEPLFLPTMGPKSLFFVPLFLKSDIQGNFVIKLRFEYTPHADLSTPVAKEFIMKLNVLRPFALNFGVTSTLEAPCGAPLGSGPGAGGSSASAQWKSVLRGDVINLTTSLNCLSSLNRNLEVLTFGVVRPSSVKASKQVVQFVPSESVFSIIDPWQSQSQKKDRSEKIVSLMLRGHSDSSGADSAKLITIGAGEKYVSGIDVRCLEVEEDATASQSLSAFMPSSFLRGSSDDASTGDKLFHSPLCQSSIGNVSIKWRTDDRSQLSPLDLSSYLAGTDLKIADTWHPDAKPGTIQHLFRWLLPFGSETDIFANMSTSSDDSSAARTPGLEYTVSRTLVCSMTFSIPNIQILDAPFHVKVEVPTTAEVGSAIPVVLRVTNKLWSLERIAINLTLSNRFLVTGCTHKSFEIPPRGSVSVGYLLVPLSAGHQPLPLIKVTWERSASGNVLVEVGSSEHPKHVFVRPASAPAVTLTK